MKLVYRIDMAIFYQNYRLSVRYRFKIFRSLRSARTSDHEKRVQTDRKNLEKCLTGEFKT